jgi:ketosteroid isomerase-like protein
MDTTTTSSPERPADPREVLGRYLEIVRRGDATALRDCFAPDATWLLRGDLPIAGDWRGRDTIVDEFLAAALGFYEPGSIELIPTGMVAEGDRVVLEWISRARTRAGAPYENHCIGVFTVREGRIQAVREYMDTLYAHRVAFSRRPGEGMR